MTPKSKFKLGLHLPTDPRWVNLAEMDLHEILSDHAFCEQKATTTCISMIQAYPDKERLVEELSPIVTEEWGHFRLVIQEMKKRGMELGKQRKDEYVNKLMAFAKQTMSQSRLVERLLTSALIEARSCERFRLLSLHIADDELKEFYHKFMVSEAGHYRMFIDLAKLYGDDDDAVMVRWQEYLDYEAEMLTTLEVRGDRIH